LNIGVLDDVLIFFALGNNNIAMFEFQLLFIYLIE